MSDTPRTNAVLDWFYDDMGGKYAVIDKFTELCYELERENAALRAALSEIKAYSVGWKEEVARKALDAARKEQS
jgi:hypothetical protein